MRIVSMRAGRVAAALALVAAAAAVTVTSAQAATFTVTRNDDPAPGSCDPGDCSLREAVVAANAAAGGDTIVLPSGAYALTIPSSGEGPAATVATEGDLDVTDGLTLQVSGGAATIDAGARFSVGANGVSVSQPGTGDRVLHARASLTTVNVTVTGGSSDQGAGVLVDRAFLTMTGGGVAANAANGFCCGGGIAAIQSNVTLTSASISGNAVTNCCGGGIYNESSAVAIDGGTVDGNDAFGCCGGGIYNWTDPNAGRTATLSVSGVALTANDVRSCCGGAIFNESASPTNVTIANSTFRDNVSSTDCCGGALYSAPEATVSIADTSFSGNSTAACCGGAIYNEGSLTFTRGAITNNSVVNCCGGGLGSAGAASSATLVNVTISGNQAGGEPGQAALSSGGGAYLDTGRLELTHVTIATNTGTNGASGLANGDVGGASQGTLTIGRSIVANNTGAPQCVGALTSTGHNISSDPSCTFTQPTDLKSTDPRLGPLTDSGVAGGVHELNAGSPAIDAVAANQCPPPTTDQRGMARPQDRTEAPGALCDAGAVEMPGNVPTTPTPVPTPTPTTTPTPAPASPTPTPSPSASATPTPTPTTTASPTPTPTASPGPIDPRCDDPGVVCGTDGSETINGTDDGELIICGEGVDRVEARGGDDTIVCGDEDDPDRKVIFGGPGDDAIDCPGNGDDAVHGGGGDDGITCGRGEDFLEGGRGHDLVTSTGGPDTVIGNAGNDFVAGGPGRDDVRGGGGRDRLKGGSGNDDLRGQAGEDVLIGGNGKRDRCARGRGDRLRSCELPPRRSGR